MRKCCTCVALADGTRSLAPVKDRSSKNEKASRLVEKDRSESVVIDITHLLLLVHSQSSVLRLQDTESFAHFPITLFFPTFGVMKEVAVGVIMNGNRILACQRKWTACYPLKWEFPGGKLEPGETAEHALIRELREELNIKPVIGARFHSQEWFYPEGAADAGGDAAFHVFYYRVPSFVGELTNKAFEQIRWVSPVELQGMDILEGNKDAVDLLVKYAEQHQEA